MIFKRKINCINDVKFGEKQTTKTGGKKTAFTNKNIHQHKLDTKQQQQQQTSFKSTLLLLLFKKKIQMF